MLRRQGHAVDPRGATILIDRPPFEIDGARTRGPRHQSFGAENRPAAARSATTFRLATSFWAVTTTFGERSTRGVQPRCSCAARRPATTANSNAFMSSGRLIMSISSASPNHPGEHNHADGNRAWHQEREPAADRPIVSGPSRQPSDPTRVEIRISPGLQWHEALTSGKALVRARPGRPKAQKSR